MSFTQLLRWEQNIEKIKIPYPGYLLAKIFLLHVQEVSLQPPDKYNMFITFHLTSFNSRPMQLKF